MTREQLNRLVNRRQRERLLARARGSAGRAGVGVDGKPAVDALTTKHMATGQPANLGHDIEANAALPLLQQTLDERHGTGFFG